MKSFKPMNYWNIKKHVLKDARKYKKRKDWYRNSGSAIVAAKRNGWYVEATKHMVSTWTPPGTWTKEKIITTMKPYIYYSDWRKSQRRAYHAAVRLGLTNQIIKLLAKTPHHKTTKIWHNDEMILKDALKYKHRNTWSLNSSAYEAAKRKGIFEQATDHMTLKKKGPWSREIVFELARKMKGKKTKEFIKQHPQAYQYASRHGIWDELRDKYLKRCGNKKSRAIYSIEFVDNIVYVGLSYDPDLRLENHLKSKHIVGLKALETKFQFVCDFKFHHASKAAQLEISTIEKYRRNGWIILNKAKGGGLGGRLSLWTKETILSRAFKYQTVKAWLRYDKKTYTAAHRLGILKEATSHMDYVQLRKDKWTSLNKVLASALEYETSSSWKEANIGAYRAAIRYGWLKKCTRHMKSMTKEWTSKSAVLKNAKKYRIKKDWKIKSPGAYQAARKKGWFQEATKHMEVFSKPKGYWNEKSRVINVALKCNTSTEFNKSYPGAYRVAFLKGWIIEIRQIYKSKAAKSKPFTRTPKAKAV